jgi:hypothetical protein
MTWQGGLKDNSRDGRGQWLGVKRTQAGWSQKPERAQLERRGAKTMKDLPGVNEDEGCNCEVISAGMVGITVWETHRGCRPSYVQHGGRGLPCPSLLSLRSSLMPSLSLFLRFEGRAPQCCTKSTATDAWRWGHVGGIASSRSWVRHGSDIIRTLL